MVMLDTEPVFEFCDVHADESGTVHGFFLELGSVVSLAYQVQPIAHHLRGPPCNSCIQH